MKKNGHERATSWPGEGNDLHPEMNKYQLSEINLCDARPRARRAHAVHRCGRSV